MLPPAASKRAHFHRSLLTSGLLKHYILSLFNPGSELFYLEGRDFWLKELEISVFGEDSRLGIAIFPDFNKTTKAS